MKKGEIYEGVIEKVDFPNKGIVITDGQKVTVKNGMPGQKVRFMINKKRSGRAEGRLLEVLEKSPLETREPVCSIFPECGGRGSSGGSQRCRVAEYQRRRSHSGRDPARRNDLQIHGVSDRSVRVVREFRTGR